MDANGRRRLRWMVVGGVIAASVGIAVGVGWPTADPAPTPATTKVISTPTTWVTCCASRKVTPMARHLETKAAWVSGLRRSDSPTRAGTRPSNGTPATAW